MTQKFDRRVLPITSAVAAALLATGCSRNPGTTDTADADVRVCRDAQGRRVEDNDCRSRAGGAVGWYYLNRGSSVARVGDTQMGGDFSPAAGRSYSDSSSVTRGGLGLSGRSVYS
ncbi:hypothetical protein [Sphingobium sp.]|uniref:hypothetical protein n=1 Tax=Sphingobium sp. TaxID=1912891 RepID=UPI00261F2B33|nr:hypothetical protein [Sphingobium sp.]